MNILLLAIIIVIGAAIILGLILVVRRNSRGQPQIQRAVPQPHNEQEAVKNGLLADAVNPYSFGGLFLGRENKSSATAVSFGAGNPMRRGPGNLQGTNTILQTGELHIDRVDLEVPGRGEIHFHLYRRYRSRLNHDGPLGHGWTLTYFERLFIQGNGHVIRHDGTGHVDTWVRNPDGSYQAPKGFFCDLIRRSDNTFVLREPDGFKRVYSAEGRIEQQEDRYGNTLTFEYGSSGNLTRVVDAYQREYDFTYGDFGGVDRLIKVRDFAGREVIYGYDTEGNLRSYRTPIVAGTSTGNDFPAGKLEQYNYSTALPVPELNHKLIALTLPVEVANGGQSAMRVDYGSDPADTANFGRVTSQELGGSGPSGAGTGGTIAYQRELQNAAAPLGQPGLPRARVRVTERNGNISDFFSDELGHCVLIQQFTRGFRSAEPVSYETRMEYDSEGQLARIVHPEGNEYQYQYDRNGPRRSQCNLLKAIRIADTSRGGDDTARTFIYEPLFNQVQSITDPRGNDPNYTPPLGTASPDRYRTFNYFDYQQGNDVVAEATEFGIDLSGVQRGLGDLNGDGRTDQALGNVVRISGPNVSLRPNAQEAARRRGQTVQVILHELHWNDSGQPLREIDAEGNTKQFEYFPANDPSESGVRTPGATDTSASGYLRATIVDADVSSRRTTAAALIRQTNSFSYDRVGNLTGTLNPRGVSMEFEVNQLNQVVRGIRGADVARATADGHLLTGEAALKYELRVFYDENNRIVRSQIENRDSNMLGLGTHLEYTYRYDTLSNPLQWSTRADRRTTLEWHVRYDANSLLEKMVLPEGNVIAWAYDERDFLLEKVHGFGTADARTVRFNYDKNGNCVELVHAEDMDGDGIPEKTRFRFDGLDRIAEVVDAIGNQLQKTYDPTDNVTNVKLLGHPAGKPNDPNVLLSDTYYRHDELGRSYQVDKALFVSDGFIPIRPVNLVDGNNDGFVTDFVEFDALDRVSYETDDDGHTTSYVYDGADRMVEATDPLGNRKRTEYDPNNNPVVIRSLQVSPENLAPDDEHVVFLMWDQLNRLVQVSADQTLRYSYDSRDNLVLVSDAQGRLMSDPLGLLSGRINSPGNTIRYLYDGLDRLIGQQKDLRIDGQGDRPVDHANPFNPDGVVSLLYEYDGNSRLTGITDDSGNKTAFHHDALDRVILDQKADGTTNRYAYDRNDNLTYAVDPNGTHIAMQYDALNRLIRRTIVPASGVIGSTEEEFAYDGQSRLTFSSDNNGDPQMTQRVERIYSSLSQVVEETQNGQVASHALAGDGRRVSTIYPGSRQIDYRHDEINRLKAIADQNGDICKFFYMGPESRELLREMSDGTTQSYMNQARNLVTGYDKFERVIRDQITLPGGSRFLDREYRYNRADFLLSEKRHDDNGQSDHFSYDSAYRLTRSTYDSPRSSGGRPTNSVDYALDGVGNRRDVQQSSTSGIQRDRYHVNEVNEYRQINGEDLVYDDNGNLKSDDQREFHYDYKNRLVLVTRKADGTPIANYYYDASNRRTRKRVFSPSNPGAIDEDRLSFYDGFEVCEDQDANNRTLQTFVHLPHAIDSQVQIERTNQHPLGNGAYFIHRNYRGDVIAATENGAVVERRYYDDYGTMYDETKSPTRSSSVGNPFGIQGLRIDEETGLYYVRNRYYDSELGRFLQRDPAWDPENVGNPYTFCGNSPLNGSDPMGTDFIYKKGRKVFYVPEGLFDLNGTELFVGNLDPNDSDSIRIGRRDGRLVTTSYSELSTKAEGAWFSDIKDLGDLQEALGICKKTDRIEPPGFLESLIPVWGSGRMAIYEAERGGGFTNYFAYSLLAASDVLVVGWLAKSALKVGGKLSAATIPRLWRMIPAKTWHELLPALGASLRATWSRGSGHIRIFLNRFPQWSHFIWRSGDEWLHAFGGTPFKDQLPIQTFFRPAPSILARTPETFGRMLTSSRSFHPFSYIPLLSTRLPALTGGTARTCLGAAVWAMSRGNYHIPYFMLKGWLQLPTVQGVRNPGASPEDFWNLFDWDDLTPEEQDLWGTLGWDGDNWYAEENDDIDPADSESKEWSELTEEEQEAAGKLGYNEATWNAAE